MQHNPYGADAVRLAVDLARSRPGTAAELRRICDAHDIRLARRPTRVDVETVDRAVTDWLAVVDAPDERTRVSLLNAMLASHTSHPRLTDHAGDGWHMHYRPDRIEVGHQVAALVSSGTALHLAGRGMHRLARCADVGCAQPFADLSRNGTQRYCSPTCANRDAVRRHRARR